MRAGFPHSEIPGSKPVCRLPGAYRKLLRPSSPVIAKASTICTCSLDPITLKPRAGRFVQIEVLATGILTLVPESIRLGRNRVDTIATHASTLGDRCTCFFRIVKERTASPVKRPEVSLGAYLRSLGNLDQATVSFFILLLSSFQSGGGERDRTDDLLLAKQALSQLSYTPDKKLVGLDGFEPSTPALSRRCSNQLSYRP